MTPIASRPATAAQVRGALDAAAEVGPFFRLEVGKQGWQPAAAFYRDALAELAVGTAGRLGITEPHVAASTVHLDLAARLWSPVLGAGLLRGVVPDLRVLTVSVDPVRLALARPAGWLLTSAAELAPVSASVAVPELATLAAGLRPRLAGGLVRGNSASAMVAALKVLAMAHPELTAAASRLARALLQVPGLRGAGTLADADDVGLQFPGFRRRSCCLYYRVPGGGLCGDCCLARVPAG